MKQQTETWTSHMDTGTGAIIERTEHDLEQNRDLYLHDLEAWQNALKSNFGLDVGKRRAYALLKSAYGANAVILTQ